MQNFCKCYPKSTVQDFLVHIYESCFGQFCQKEPRLSEINYKGKIAYSVEPLNENFVKLHLPGGIQSQALAKLSKHSAKRFQVEVLQQHFTKALVLSEQNIIPFSKKELQTAINKWRNKQFVLLTHSQSFIENYGVNYYIVQKQFLPYVPLFFKLDLLLQQDHFVLAIDGPCAAGKSILAKLLQDLYACNVFHMDHFFLQAHQRTPKRMQIPGENIDHERFLQQVLLPLANKQIVEYQRLDCANMQLSQAEHIAYTPFTVVEGTYSLHPNLKPFYCYTVFLDVEPGLQLQRLARRNPQKLSMFVDKWIPLEQAYHQKYNVAQSVDLYLQN